MDREKTGKALFNIDDRGYNAKAWYVEDVEESKGDALVEIRYNGHILREFIFPAYKIWNIHAHFTDIVDGEINSNKNGYEIAASNGI